MDIQVAIDMQVSSHFDMVDAAASLATWQFHPAQPVHAAVMYATQQVCL